MVPLYPTLWSLVKTWETGEDTAFIFSGEDPEEAAEKLTFRDFYEKIIENLRTLKKESLPLEFECARTPDALAKLIANLLIGNDLLLLEPAGAENSTLPEGFEKSLVPPSPDNTSLELYDSNVPEGHVLFFTSGTTASSKAVILSTRALLRACFNGQSLSEIKRGDILLSALPLSHVFGFICSFLWGLAYGATVALFRGMRNFFNDFSFFRPTVISVVPAMADVLVKAGSLNPELRLMIIGAAPASSDTLDALEKMGIEAHLGYGLTETASGIALHHKDTDPLAFTPCPDCDFSVAEDGEILVSTESMMDGYLNGDTNEVLQNGVLHTGDFGFIDERGNIHITGRKKDMIVLGNGTKVFLPEYEQGIENAVRIEDFAAIQSKKGQIVLFIGAPLPDGLTEDEVRKRIDEFNSHTPRDRQIADIIFMPGQLPKTRTGKIRRYLLNA